MLAKRHPYPQSRLACNAIFEMNGKSHASQLWEPKPSMLSSTFTIKSACLLLHAGNISATGYHFLRILQGDAHCNLMLRKASKKWDSCAGEALLLAVGGGLTDTVGRRYK
eukprot:scaffold593_cov382-Prasinococcus_capsulatus_cf.AAC.2